MPSHRFGAKLALCGFAIMLLALTVAWSTPVKSDPTAAILQFGLSLAGGLLMIWGAIEIAASGSNLLGVPGVIVLVAATGSPRLCVGIMRHVSADGGPLFLILLVLRVVGLVFFSSALLYRYWGAEENPQPDRESAGQFRELRMAKLEPWIHGLSRISIVLGVVLWEFFDGMSPWGIRSYLRRPAFDTFMMLAAILAVLRGMRVKPDMGLGLRLALAAGFVVSPFLESASSRMTHLPMKNALGSPPVLTAFAIMEFIGTAALVTEFQTKAGERSRG